MQAGEEEVRRSSFFADETAIAVNVSHRALPGVPCALRPTAAASTRPGTARPGPKSRPRPARFGSLKSHEKALRLQWDQPEVVTDGKQRIST